MFIILILSMLAFLFSDDAFNEKICKEYEGHTAGTPDYDDCIDRMEKLEAEDSVAYQDIKDLLSGSSVGGAGTGRSSLYDLHYIDRKEGRLSKENLYNNLLGALESISGAGTATRTIEEGYKKHYQGENFKTDADLQSMGNKKSDVKDLGFIQQLRQIELRLVADKDNQDIKQDYFGINNINLNLPPELDPQKDEVGYSWLNIANKNQNKSFQNYDLSGLNINEFLNLDIGSSDELKSVNLQTNMKSILNNFSRANYSLVINNPLYNNFVDQLARSIALSKIKKSKQKMNKQEATKQLVAEYRKLKTIFLQKMFLAAKAHKDKVNEIYEKNKQYKNLIANTYDIDRFDENSDIFGLVHARYDNRYKAGLLLVTYEKTGQINQQSTQQNTQNSNKISRKPANKYKNEVFKKW